MRIANAKIPAFAEAAADDVTAGRAWRAAPRELGQRRQRRGADAGPRAGAPQRRHHFAGGHRLHDLLQLRRRQPHHPQGPAARPDGPRRDRSRRRPRARLPQEAAAAPDQLRRGLGLAVVRTGTIPPSEQPPSENHRAEALALKTRLNFKSLSAGILLDCRFERLDFHF